MENKITIEITSEGWTKTAVINGTSFVEQWELDNSGAHMVSPSSFETNEDVPEELYEATDNLNATSTGSYDRSGNFGRMSGITRLK